MTARSNIFAAVRAARPDIFNTYPSAISDLDELLDRYGVPRDDAPQPSASDLPADYFTLLAKIESGHRPYVKASTSSASGLYQFIKATWLGEGGKWGSDMSKAFGGLFPSEDEQTRRARSFTEKNAAYLRKNGIPINSASLYAAHFLGPQTAVKVIGADVGARADALAGENATKANPSILRGKTVGEFLSWLHSKTGAWAK